MLKIGGDIIKNVCKECGGELFIGEIETYCRKCGLIVDDAPINFGNEFLETDPEKAAKRRRTGAPITWLNPDFSTIFDKRDSRKIFVSRR